MSLKSYKKIIEMQQERDRYGDSPDASNRVSHAGDHRRFSPGGELFEEGPISDDDNVYYEEVYVEEVQPSRRETRGARHRNGRGREYDERRYDRRHRYDYPYDDPYDDRYDDPYDDDEGYYYERRRDRRSYSRRRPRRGIGCGAWCLIIIVALLVIAAATNPSQNEARKMIKEQTLEYVDQAIKLKMQQSAENDGFAAIASMVGMAIAPQLFDYAVDTKVNNFLFFSTFDMAVNIEAIGVNQKVISGIIVFGQMIPLESDLPKGITK